MGRVSKKTIDKDLQNELEEQLSFIVSCLTDKKEIIVFLQEFLTREEKIMLGKRLVLYMLLFRGALSKDIHESLLVSYETIRSYKQHAEVKPVTFQKIIRRLASNEKNKHLLKKIEKLMAPLELFMHAKSDMKARSKFMNGNWFD